MRKFKIKNLVVYTLSIILIGCSSTNKTKVGTENLIYMSSDKAPANCRYLGVVYGPHQTFTKGNFKSGKNISQAHINQAKKMGANYIEMNRLETEGKGFICPPSELLKMQPF
jgi:hypothetical protein